MQIYIVYRLYRNVGFAPAKAWAAAMEVTK